MYREHLIRLEELNPTHYYHVRSFGGQFVSNADKREMLKLHTRNVVIPGTMTEDVEFQAIANKENAIVSLYCIIVATNEELDVQVFLPTSGAAAHCCLNFLLLLTEHPVGSHVQPLYFGPPSLSTQRIQSHVARQIVEDSESVAITDGVIMLHTVERNDLPLYLCDTVLNEFMMQPSQSQPAPQPVEDSESKSITDDVVFLDSIDCVDLPLRSVDTALQTAQYVTSSAATQRQISLPCIIALVSALLFLMTNYSSSALNLLGASVLAFGSSGVIGDKTSYDFARKYYLSSTTNLTTILASAICGVTGDQTAYSAPYCVAVFNEMQSPVAGSFSYLIGCRVGEAKKPGPGRSRAASSNVKSAFAIRQARLSAAQVACATTAAASVDVVVPMMPLVPALPLEKLCSGEGNIPARSRAASSSPS
jgi:hypothetical protein